MTTRLAVRRPFWLLTTIGFLSYLAIGTASPFVALYIQQLHGNLADIGLVIGLGAIAGLLSNIFWGRLTDRSGQRKPFIIGAMAILTITYPLMAHVPIWWLLMPLIIINGIASAAYNVCALAALGDLLNSAGVNDGQRGKWLGSYRTGGSLAFAIAIIISGFIAQRFGYSTLYNIAGLIYITAFIVACFLPEISVRTRTPSLIQRHELGALFHLARGVLSPLILAMLAWNIPFSAVYSIWSIYIVHTLGLGSSGYARLWGLAAFLEVPSMIIAGRLADRWGRRPMFLLGFFLFTLIYLIYTILPFVPTLVIAQMLRGFAYATFTATALTAVIELAPSEERGRAASVYQLTLGCAQILGSSTGGPLANRVGFHAFFILAAIITIGGAGILLISDRSPSAITQSALPKNRGTLP